MMRRLHGQLKKPKAIFFDWDGTLVDSLAFLTKTHNRALDSLGISKELSNEEFKPYLGEPRDFIFKELYGYKSEEGKEAFVECYNKNHLTDLGLIDGAHDLLKTLNEHNVSLGVVSNKRGDFLRKEISYLKWDAYFSDRVVGAGDTSEDKPNPEPLNHCMKLIEGDYGSQDIWYVGDTDIDMKCAQAAGVIGILYNPELHSVGAVKTDEGLDNNQFFINKYTEISCFFL